ncbi:MAG: YadA-like family protein, partial [Veillonella sp.]|nr:YadA-like family protein [Veillonella sp.]
DSAVAGGIKFTADGGKKIGDEYVNTFVTVGEGDNSFKLETGSNVVGTNTGDYLSKLTINGEEFNLGNQVQVEAADNTIKVVPDKTTAGTTVYKVSASDVANPGKEVGNTYHNWTINRTIVVDPETGETKEVTLTDTTLVGKEVDLTDEKLPEADKNTITFKDTADNTVTYTGVASLDDVEKAKDLATTTVYAEDESNITVVDKREKETDPHKYLVDLKDDISVKKITVNNGQGDSTVINGDTITTNKIIIPGATEADNVVINNTSISYGNVNITKEKITINNRNVVTENQLLHSGDLSGYEKVGTGEHPDQLQTSINFYRVSETGEAEFAFKVDGIKDTQLVSRERDLRDLPEGEEKNTITFTDTAGNTVTYKGVASTADIEKAKKEAATTLTEHGATDNIIVEKTVDETDGHFNYDVKLNKDLTAESITLNNNEGNSTTINGDTIQNINTNEEGKKTTTIIQGDTIITGYIDEDGKVVNQTTIEGDTINTTNINADKILINGVEAATVKDVLAEIESGTTGTSGETTQVTTNIFKDGAGEEIGRTVSKNDTLVKGDVYAAGQDETTSYDGKPLGSDYTIKDTDGNEVVLKDVVSGADMQKYVSEKAYMVTDFSANDTIDEGVTKTAINKDGEVQLTLSDNTNKTFKVALTDVARKSDVDTINKNIGDVSEFNTEIKGDNIVQRINNTYEVAKAHNTVAAGNNVEVTTSPIAATGGTEYKVSVSKNLKDMESITFNNSKVQIGKDGINAGGKKVTNVAPGDITPTSSDAVNGAQLYATNSVVNNIATEVNNFNGRLNGMDSRINKVGAGAAALAALHPMDFDPDDKLSFAVGTGHYKGQTAAAIGAFYRPTEKVMFSLGATAGNGENMVNFGASFSLDPTPRRTNIKTALAQENLELRDRVARLEQLVGQLVGGKPLANEYMPFPDVPENHWAYEYIAKLHANGILEGYPDGNFDGNRTLTRYEFATAFCRALERGIKIDPRAIHEFEKEMARIRVDHVRGEDGTNKKVSRVRLNKAPDRDNYGNKISVVK